MSKLGEKERKELRRRAFELHLQDDQLIAVGHVAIRSAMLDKLIDLTFEQIIRHYPETLRNELDRLSSPKRIKVIQDDLTKVMPGNKHAIHDFINEIFSVRDERNDILHRMWRSTESPEVKILVEVSHDAPELEKRRVTAQSMRATADRLLDLAIELGDWKMAFNAALLRRSVAAPGTPAPPVFQ
jgi:hypothetical protein